jgi:hypothetical protein
LEGSKVPTLVHADSVLENLRSTSLEMKSEDIKISNKLLVQILDDKTIRNRKNIKLLAAGFFHPYLKKSVTQSIQASLIEVHILDLLNDQRMTEFYDDYDKKLLEQKNQSEDEADTTNEQETFGANKRLKFDKYFDFSSSRPEKETAEQEYRRYKDARLTKEDICILFGSQVLLF